MTRVFTGVSAQSAAEQLSGYTYVPVDPFPVSTYPGRHCEAGDEPDRSRTVRVSQIPDDDLLKSLPDNAVRTTVETFFSNGSVSYGPAKVSSGAESYRMTVDYINSDTTHVALWIKREAEIYGSRPPASGKTEAISLFMPTHNSKSRYTVGSDEYTVVSDYALIADSPDVSDYQYINLPVYVGIGLRATADISNAKADVNISGLGAIGVEADGAKLTGSLTVQTLGVNGQAISSALPIQSELNRTTAQNAITAVASIKALLYEQGTLVQPRVVGIYLPFPGGKALVNAVVSELSVTGVLWERPCSVQRDDEPPKVVLPS